MPKILPKTIPMKNKILFSIVIISVFALVSFGQEHKIPVDKKIKDQAGALPSSVRTAKSYHVEENIRMNFGGYTTTYNVSDSSLISTNDLGPNNKRVVSQRFAKVERQMALPKQTIADSLKPSAKPFDLKPTDSIKKQSGYAYVVMIKTYERIAEKGYKSVDIFQKLGDAFYFDDEMDKAARWYGELFAMNPALEAEYYYRYSHSLRAIGQNEKSNEMLEKFSKLSGSNNGK